MTIPLQKTCIYGPINSRRLGRSLGINILPYGVKVCNFNCIYCQYGESMSINTEFPDSREIIDCVEEVVGQEPEIDHITFSGNGEPTLHPKFNIIVDAIKKIRDIIMPHVPIALLTNGTGFRDFKKREALKLIDKVIVKIDAGDEDYFQKINRPMIPLMFKDHLKYLKTYSPIFTQTLFFDNSFSNCDREAIGGWYKTIKSLGPKVAQIYSLDRPTNYQNIKHVTYETLLRIAQEGQKLTKVRIEAFAR